MRSDRARQDAFDSLLGWCSEVGSGTTVQLRAACQSLDLRFGRATWTLSQLGHCEVDWDHGLFAMTPTTLTTIPGLAGKLLLAGARPYGLIADLAAHAEQSSLDIDISREPCHQYGAGPSTVLLDADAGDAEQFAADTKIAFSPQAHAQIARLLPTITTDTASVPHRPDTRFPHTTVDPHSFQARWDLNVDDGHPGLWLYQTWGQQQNMVLLDDSGREGRLVLQSRYAPYLMDRPADADPIVQYKPASRVLIVNSAAPLPELHARSACLCSGRMPIHKPSAPDIAYDHYVNVDPGTATYILTSLGAAA